MNSELKGRPSSRKVIAIALSFQALLILVLWLAAPLRKSSMIFNPEEAREKAKKVAQANKERIKAEKIQREKTMLSKQDAEKLKKKEGEKRKRKLDNKLKEMRAIKVEIIRKKIGRIKHLKKRNPGDMNKAKMPQLLAAAQSIPNELVHLKIRSGSKFADSLHQEGIGLFEDTKKYLDDFSLSGLDEIRKKASMLEENLTQEQNSNATRIGPNQMSNFNIFGNNAIRKIAIFQNLLGSLKISKEAIGELNQVPEELVQELLYSPEEEPPINKMSFDEVVEEITSLEQDISEEYKEFRAADLADLQGTSFEEAMDVVNTSLGENKNEHAGEEENANQEGSLLESSQQDEVSKDGGSQKSHSQSKESVQGSQKGEGKKQNEQVSEFQQSAHSQAEGNGQKNEGSEGKSSSAQARGKHANNQKNSPSVGSPNSQNENRGIKTVGDLNAYRSKLDDQVNSASSSYSKARNMGKQAGVLSAEKSTKGREASFLKGANSRVGQGGGDFSSSSVGNHRNQSGSYASAALASLGKKKNNLTIKIPEEMVKAKALPGRKFEKKSSRQGWLYLDTWYTIGPWENAGKLDYSKTHQPELEVDLEAVYRDGKMNSQTQKPRELKWKFVQSNQMKIKMPDEQPNSTYYCSTEVYFEEATEMLVAIASDDAARLWVNEKLVWEDRGWSAWDLSEGFRSILFKKGFNDVLVRLENFPVLCEFSVLLCPSK
jgi:hypothetical protein